MKKIKASSLSFACIYSTLFLVGCNCYNIDCASEAAFNFKLVDKATGADAVYDLGISVEEFKVTSLSTSDQVPIEKFESNQSLFYTFTPSSLEYKIEYRGQIIILTLKITGIGSECCTDYEVTSINSNVETLYDSGNKLFFIKIDL